MPLLPPLYTLVQLKLAMSLSVRLVGISFFAVAFKGEKESLLLFFFGGWTESKAHLEGIGEFQSTNTCTISTADREGE